MHRRKFISDSCLTCAAIVGGGFLMNALQSCTSIARLKTSDSKKEFRVDALLMNETNVLLIQRADNEFDALLVKTSQNEFVTLEMKCSHQQQPLTANATGLHCASHGSSFDLNGNARREPAIEPLNKFPTRFENNTVIIQFNSYLR